MKEIVAEILKKAIKEAKIKTNISLENYIEIPKDFEKGDFAFPCFILSKELKENPNDVAIRIREEIKQIPEGFEEIQTAGPYINFFLNKKTIIKNLIEEARIKKGNYGAKEKNNKRIMVEFPSPNTNKPLHLGHLRNMAIGESISRIAQSQGFEVIRANLNNDRGIHICKSMLAYKKWGKDKTPKKEKQKSDHFVGDYYVLFNKKLQKDKELEKEAQDLLKNWELGDKETLALWEKMNSWALEGFKETYEKFGIKLDKEYFESEIYTEGKEIILEGLKKNIFKKNKEGAVEIDLSKEKLGKKILLRSDGTSIYITQDIYLAKKKFEDYNLEESVYVTGNEQEYHFKVLFNVLEKLKIASENKLKHLSYGMVNLPNGRMKSREGTVVDADDLINEVQELVKKDLSSRQKLGKKKLEESSLKIALAAIKYFLLKVDIKRNMAFNPEESISFEGDTGPYLEYSYARATSIINKSKEKGEMILPEEFEDKEKELIAKLNDFKKTVEDAFKSMNPAIIANYAFKLSQVFNEFYHSEKVIGSDYEVFRIKLTDTFRQILKNSLYLLGIEVVEEM